MKLTFYGVRGSIPTPGADTVKYGGNTACILLETDDGHKLIFDAGTGIHKLGQELAETADPLFLLLSHAHWDHIQGLPFFRPLYQAQRTIHFITTHQDDVISKAALGQFATPCFPVTTEALAADIRITPLDGRGEFQAGAVRISTQALNHPGGGLAYRVDTPQGCIVYLTDNELFPPETPATSYPQWVRFVAGADILIHDAMYLENETRQTRGWGHSLVSHAMQLAKDAKVTRLILFHHDPAHSDQQLDNILQDCRQVIKKERAPKTVEMAREGDSYLL